MYIVPDPLEQLTAYANFCIFKINVACGEDYQNMTECISDTRVVFTYYWVLEDVTCMLVPYSEQQCCTTPRVGTDEADNTDVAPVPVVETHTLPPKYIPPPTYFASAYKRILKGGGN